VDAVALLRNRVEAVGANTRSLIAQAEGVDWVTPVLPGTSPLGLTLWHLPRTVDWLVNTTVLGAAEVADSPAYADLPAPDVFGFGTGLTQEQASELAGHVRAQPLLAYVEKVHAMADAWLATLSDEDLDAPVAAFRDNQRRRPSYSTDAALAEIQHLPDLPLGQLVLRPAISHLLMHGGEIDLLIQHAKRQA
jgi:hypothetical protein